MPLARLVRAALLFTSVLAFPSPARAQDDPARFIARIEGAQSPNRQGFDPLTLPQILERFHVPGVSVAVIKDFKIHWAKGYGVADVTTNRMVDTTTAFQAASISKPVTAMATVRLAQEGRLSLDQDINPLLPSWHVPESDLNRTQPVTPRSLLSHTSGSDDGFGFPGLIRPHLGPLWSRSSTERRHRPSGRYGSFGRRSRGRSTRAEAPTSSSWPSPI